MFCKDYLLFWIWAGNIPYRPVYTTFKGSFYDILRLRSVYRQLQSVKNGNTTAQEKATGCDGDWILLRWPMQQYVLAIATLCHREQSCMGIASRCVCPRVSVNLAKLAAMEWQKSLYKNEQKTAENTATKTKIAYLGWGDSFVAPRR